MTQPRLISEYMIARSHTIDNFEEQVQEALADGWQPMNRHGYESSDDYDYIMEFVRTMEADEYREMVYGLREDRYDAEATEAYENSQRGDDGDARGLPNGQQSLIDAIKRAIATADIVDSTHFNSEDFEV